MTHRWIPMHDYLCTETAGWSTQEMGAYFLLVMEYWQHGGIKRTDEQMARITKMTMPEWLQAKPTLLEIFEAQPDGRWIHPRIESEMAQARFAKSRREYEYTDKRALDVSQSEWNRLRVQVFERDGFRCTYCGATEDPIECDHVMPFSRGGMSTLDNLTTACKPCNRRKSSMTPDEWRNASRG